MGLIARLLASLAANDTPAGRASRLLRDNLTAAQLAQYRRHGYFEVRGGETGRRYRIYRGAPVNVDECDPAGICVHTWCFGSIGNLEQGDILLAQKVALEAFESEARKVGKRYAPGIRSMWARRVIPYR